MAKVLIVYATRAGGTKRLAEMIADGIRAEGKDVEIKPVTYIKKREDLQGYDAYVFGSATYHGSMIQAMKKMLFMAEGGGLNKKPGAAFGTYGWSGEAPIRIYETMKNIFEMDMVGKPFRVKTADITSPEVKEQAEKLGREIAKKI